MALGLILACMVGVCVCMGACARMRPDAASGGGRGGDRGLHLGVHTWRRTGCAEGRERFMRLDGRKDNVLPPPYAAKL